MTSKALNLVSYLRSRPALERRILAVCVYASIAAVIVALWVVSFRDNLARITEAPALAAPAPNGEAAPTRLSSPFGMLSGTWRQMREELRAILPGTERIGPDDRESRIVEPEPERHGADAIRESGGIRATEEHGGGEITVRYLAEETRPELAEGKPTAPAKPADLAPVRLNTPSAPALIAPILAGKLAAANALGEERAPATENPAAYEGGRIGFFAAFAGILSAALRSLAGFFR